jgi:hypothetical protein
MRIRANFIGPPFFAASVTQCAALLSSVLISPRISLTSGFGHASYPRSLGQTWRVSSARAGPQTHSVAFGS